MSLQFHVCSSAPPHCNTFKYNSSTLHASFAIFHKCHTCWHVQLLIMSIVATTIKLINTLCLWNLNLRFTTCSRLKYACRLSILSLCYIIYIWKRLVFWPQIMFNICNPLKNMFWHLYWFIFVFSFVLWIFGIVLYFDYLQWKTSDHV